MKKLLFTALISLGTLGLMTTTASAKCGGEDKTKMEKPAKCDSGKCGTDKAKDKAEEATEEVKEEATEAVKKAGKCGAGKCGGK